MNISKVNISYIWMQTIYMVGQRDNICRVVDLND